LAGSDRVRRTKKPLSKRLRAQKRAPPLNSGVAGRPVVGSLDAHPGRAPVTFSLSSFVPVPDCAKSGVKSAAYGDARESGSGGEAELFCIAIGSLPIDCASHKN
jgi:hypothetical protein